MCSCNTTKTRQSLTPLVQMPSPARQQWGFTLVEVLVALAITAIAITAGMQATGALVRNTQRQSDIVLAQLCAENALAGIRLSKQLPNIGDASATCEQANLPMTVTLIVRPTLNPSFRRADAQVFQGESSVLRLSTIVGRY